MTTVAAFDVDGTLTTRDCVVAFMRRTRGTATLVARLARRAPALIGPVLRRDRDAVKSVATEAAFAGCDVDDLERDAASFAVEVSRSHLRHDTVERLRWHLGLGHQVVLVSASYEVYLRHLAVSLGAHDVVGTRLEVVEGRCTGSIDGANCRGPEKVERLHAWLDAHHGGRGAVEVWAYGDSAGDRDLLADADHAVWAREPIDLESVT